MDFLRSKYNAVSLKLKNSIRNPKILKKNVIALLHLQIELRQQINKKINATNLYNKHVENNPKQNIDKTNVDPMTTRDSMVRYKMRLIKDEVARPTDPAVAYIYPPTTDINLLTKKKKYISSINTLTIFTNDNIEDFKQTKYNKYQSRVKNNKRQLVTAFNRELIKTPEIYALPPTNEIDTVKFNKKHHTKILTKHDSKNTYDRGYILTHIKPIINESTSFGQKQHIIEPFYKIEPEILFIPPTHDNNALAKALHKPKQLIDDTDIFDNNYDRGYVFTHIKPIINDHTSSNLQQKNNEFTKQREVQVLFIPPTNEINISNFQC
jgi:hypothetical protein